MEHSTGSSPLPAGYYRGHAARVRALARDATTPAVKKHLEGVALDYERLAHRVDESGAAPADGAYPRPSSPGRNDPGQSKAYPYGENPSPRRSELQGYCRRG